VEQKLHFGPLKLAILVDLLAIFVGFLLNQPLSFGSGVFGHRFRFVRVGLIVPIGSFPGKAAMFGLGGGFKNAFVNQLSGFQLLVNGSGPINGLLDFVWLSKTGIALQILELRSLFAQSALKLDIGFGYVFRLGVGALLRHFALALGLSLRGLCDVLRSLFRHRIILGL